MAFATNTSRLPILLFQHLIKQHQLLRYVVLLLRLLTAMRLPFIFASHLNLRHEWQSWAELLEQATDALHAVIHIQIAAVQPCGEVREVGRRAAGIGNLP